MKVVFLNRLLVSPLDLVERDARRRWRLEEPFSAEIRNKERWILTVPAGFETDFASVPRLPVSWWVAGDIGHESAVLHDYLYRTGGRLADRKVSRPEADMVFLSALKAEGVPLWRRQAMYMAVRAFGASSFRS